MEQPVDEQLVRDKVCFELARVFNDRMVASAFVSPLGIGFIAWLQTEAAGARQALVWSTLIVIAELLIIGSGRGFFKAASAGRPVQPWLNTQLACCGLVGAVWGSAPWFVWSPDKFLFYITTMCVLVGVAFSCIVVMTPVRWAIHCFLAGLALVPLVQLAFISTPISAQIGVGWAIMIAIQLWYARQLRRELVGQFESSVRNVLLVDQLKQIGQAVTRANADLNVAMEQLNRLVTFDQLTGAYSRRYFMEELDRQVALRARHGTPVSLIMLDLDHFKRINDSFGHSAGDRALRETVAQAKSQLRDGDLLGRIGGEEFLVLLPMTNCEAATRLAERLRTGLEALPLQEGGQRIQITASLGVAELLPNEDASTWMRRADAAQYQAKTLGRNRVVAAA